MTEDHRRIRKLKDGTIENIQTEASIKKKWYKVLKHMMSKIKES